MATLRVEAPAHTSFTATADDGVRLQSLRLGAGEPPIVYLVPHPADPALILSIPGPAAAAARISRDHTLIMPAPRYSGGSESSGPLHLARLADDVATLIEAAEVGPTLVWARRLGGVTALELARRHPELVGGLVLDNLMVHPVLRDLFGGAPSPYDRLPASDREAAISEAVGTVFASNFGAADPTAIGELIDLVRASAPLPVWARSFREMVQALQMPTRSVGLYRVAQPVLLLAAPAGVVPGERAEFTMLRRMAANAELRHHPGGASLETDIADAALQVVMNWWRTLS